MKNSYSNTDEILSKTLDGVINGDIELEKAKTIVGVTNSIIRHEAGKLKSGTKGDYWER